MENSSLIPKFPAGENRRRADKYQLLVEVHGLAGLGRGVDGLEDLADHAGLLGQDDGIGIVFDGVIPALLLGLVLRKPFVPVNEWIEEKMEETKLM